MKFPRHCIAALAGIVFATSVAPAQGAPAQAAAKTAGQGAPTQPMPMIPPPKPASQAEKAKDASGKQITVDHGGNLAIGPNDKVEFNSQVATGVGSSPIMVLSAGWIYLYDDGCVYKIRQSDMKLVAKTPIGPDVAIEPPPAPVRHSSKNKSSKRKRH